MLDPLLVTIIKQQDGQLHHTLVHLILHNTSEEELNKSPGITIMVRSLRLFLMMLMSF